MNTDKRLVSVEQIEDSPTNQRKILELLTSINHDYPVPVSDKVDLEEYIHKVFTLGIVLVAQHNENIVGFLSFYANNFEKSEGSMSLLGVLSEYRELGIAGQLFSKSFEIMKRNGMTSVYSFTHRQNKRAIRFHEKMGFRIDENRRNWYEYNISLVKDL